jgi:hypothetical protein
MYKCEMTYSKIRGLRGEWSPDLPTQRSLSEQEIKQYRAGRDALLAEVAEDLGGNVAVVEIE